MIMLQVQALISVLLWTVNLTSVAPCLWCTMNLHGSRLLKEPCKFIIYRDNTTTGCFVSCKDKTPKDFQNSVVYKFSCPGCAKAYIGKADRCLYTRLNEHATADTKSEIFISTSTLVNIFSILTNLLQLKDEHNTEQFDMTSFLLNNSYIIDRKLYPFRNTASVDILEFQILLHFESAYKYGYNLL